MVCIRLYLLNSGAGQRAAVCPESLPRARRGIWKGCACLCAQGWAVRGWNADYTDRTDTRGFFNYRNRLKLTTNSMRTRTNSGCISSYQFVLVRCLVLTYSYQPPWHGGGAADYASTFRLTILSLMPPGSVSIGSLKFELR